MNDNDQLLFDRLIKAAGELATVADQAATVLSQEFDEMCRPQIDSVRALLAECPQPSAGFFDGDGKLLDADLEVTYMKRERDPVGQSNGVHILHRPTGLGMESNSKPSKEENYASAKNALASRVQRAAEAKQR